MLEKGNKDDLLRVGIRNISILYTLVKYMCIACELTTLHVIKLDANHLTYTYKAALNFSKLN